MEKKNYLEVQERDQFTQSQSQDKNRNYQSKQSNHYYSKSELNFTQQYDYGTDVGYLEEQIQNICSELKFTTIQPGSCYDEFWNKVPNESEDTGIPQDIRLKQACLLSDKNAEK